MDAIERFLSQAAAQPNHPAIVGEDRSLSYGELECRARAFAAQIAKFDAPRVLIALSQVADAYAAIFGAGIAGGCYTPLNMAAPREKLCRIVKLLEPDVIVGIDGTIDDLAGAAPNATLIDPTALDDGDVLRGGGRRHPLAYILFTSGSTGEPKGVMLPRSALDHYVSWLQTFDIGPSDRLSQQGNLAFDISVTDIYGALCFGASLHPLLSEGDKLMPARFIAREGITVWNSVPSVISLMMQAHQITERNLRSMRLFNFCGEPLLPEHLRAIFAAKGDVKVQNTYGPTEAAVAVTCLPLEAGNHEAHVHTFVALGEPFPGMAVDLVGGPQPDEGEIVISGPQLAEGYWKDPVRTDEVFRAFERNGVTTRGYFTGDWAERRAGHLFFKERMDFQVKVRGFRVELDEVGAALRACGWPVAVVFKHEEGLVAVVESVTGQAFDENDLLECLAKRVEAHALPQAIREIGRMPRNDNDKLDRKAAVRWLEATLAREV